nr:MAG TPA: hypothetical protein [Caudoviricetes sp.]
MIAVAEVSKNPAHVAGFSRIQALFFLGLPPPTPRPGRFAFHSSIVPGSQPRALPTVTSASGSLYRARAPLVMPSLSATSVRLR